MHHSQPPLAPPWPASSHAQYSVPTARVPTTARTPTSGRSVTISYPPQVIRHQPTSSASVSEYQQPGSVPIVRAPPSQQGLTSSTATTYTAPARIVPRSNTYPIPSERQLGPPHPLFTPAPLPKTGGGVYSRKGWRPDVKEILNRIEVLVMILGAVTVLCAAVVPIFGAVALLSDENYMFWLGGFFPRMVIVAALAIILLYIVVCILLYHCAPPERLNENTMAIIAGVFAALLGLVLVLMVLPAAQAMHTTAGSLVPAGCSSTVPEVVSLMDYGQVLMNIRVLPNCTSRTSVEDCEGFAANKYTDYIKHMEQEFQCGPICMNAAPIILAPNSFIEKQHGHHHHHSRHRHRHHEQTASTDLISSTSKVSQTIYTNGLAPKLFSKGDTRTSCLPLVSTRFKVLAWVANDLIFWEGLSLICCSIFVSMASCGSICFFSAKN